jgi:hypothetical protein
MFDAGLFKAGSRHLDFWPAILSLGVNPAQNFLMERDEHKTFNRCHATPQQI